MELWEMIDYYKRHAYEEMLFKTTEAGAQTILHCCLSPDLAGHSGR